MALIEKKGYGQVEPNHLSAQRDGHIYAQLPCNIDVVENGMFLKYDLENGEINTTGDGESMLVYSEVKLYDGRAKAYKNFALLKTESSDGKNYPRLFGTSIGDFYTGNLFDVTTAKGSLKGVKLTVVNGILTETADVAGKANVWKVVKETTMADGQYALKVIRIA